MFPNDCWELILMVVLYFIGTITYSVSTRNRGSFVDTPDWSKVVRRIIELASVVVALIFLGILGWDSRLIIKILVVLFPLCGIALGGIISCSLFRHQKAEKEEGEIGGFGTKLSEHLVNAIILTIFSLSVGLVCLITLAKYFQEMEIALCCLVVLVFFLSMELAALLFHIVRLIYIDQLPNREIIQVLKIFQELNEY